MRFAFSSFINTARGAVATAVETKQSVPSRIESAQMVLLSDIQLRQVVGGGENDQLPKGGW
jgi:hypothetical protein